MPSPGNYTGGRFIGSGGVESKITVTQQMLEDNNFEKLEHVNVKVWIQHTRRGDVEVEIVSPNGIKSVLAGKRRFDNDDSGFPGWTFMSVKHWSVSHSISSGALDLSVVLGVKILLVIGLFAFPTKMKLRKTMVPSLDGI